MSLTRFAPEERELILDLLDGRAREEAILRRFGVDRNGLSAWIADRLKAGIAAQDADEIAYDLYLLFHFGPGREQLDPLHALASAPWHRSHEDVVAALDDIADASSIPALTKVLDARLPYLAYDKAFALAGKAIYALAKIQTGEALDALADRVLADPPGYRNRVLHDIALGRWQRLAEKAGSEATRSRAEAVLKEAQSRTGLFANTPQRRSILSLLNFDLSEDEFLRSIGIQRDGLDGYIAHMLEGALREKDPAAAEFALYLALHFGVSNSYVPQLRELALADWHRLQEDVAMALAESER